jgi:hypothetical protein
MASSIHPSVRLSIFLDGGVLGGCWGFPAPHVTKFVDVRNLVCSKLETPKFMPKKNYVCVFFVNVVGGKSQQSNFLLENCYRIGIPMRPE